MAEQQKHIDWFRAEEEHKLQITQVISTKTSHKVHPEAHYSQNTNRFGVEGEEGRKGMNNKREQS